MRGNLGANVGRAIARDEMQEGFGAGADVPFAARFSGRAR